MFLKDKSGKGRKHRDRRAWISLCGCGSDWICCCVGIQSCCDFMNI